MLIQRLPPLLVNQIAAGEVIERPANVVKELMENAIDAGATRIDVVIEQGGCELIRVSDDGCGIAPDDLELALAPHATSKIAAPDDLDAIATMGFRGEALASILSISRLSICSRTADTDQAMMIEGEGDQIKPLRPAGGPIGTSVTVRNLFFNTPARRKFLRTEQTEGGRISDTVASLALSHPAIGITLTADTRSRHDLPPGQSPRERTLAILGTELAEQLLEVNTDERSISIWGMVGRPAIARATAKHLRVYLNGRPIVDRSITHAVREAYRGLIEPTRWPTVVLFLEMAPAQFDVNVHPAKAEVRFRNQAHLHGAVLSAVRDALRGSDLTPAYAMSPTHAAGSRSLSFQSTTSGSDHAGHTSPDSVERSRFVEYFRRLDPQQKGFIYSDLRQALQEDAPEMLNDQIAHEQPNGESRPETSEPSSDSLTAVRSIDDCMQIHARYIITQDESGMVIIDQHALHERVMFEQLRSRLDQGNLEAQRLLMPATIQVESNQLESFAEIKPLLSRIGIEAEPIGPTSLAVHAFPSFLFDRNVQPESFLSDLLDRAARDDLTDDSEAALHEVLDMMACKAAVKSGDQLNSSELADLLKMRDTVERSSNCPHGRPTSLRLTLKDLDRQFGRE